MKAKTAYQKQVVSLNDIVKPVSDDVVSWAIENAIEHPAVRRKNNVTTCAMCGNSMVYADSVRHVRCLECGRQVRIIEADTWKSIRGTLKGWFSTISVVDGLQLQRTFEIRTKYYINGSPHQHSVRELCRHWVSPSGDLAITALPRMMGQFLDCFPFGGKIELRGTSQMVYDYIADHSEVYPEIQLIQPLYESLTYKDIIGHGSQSFLREMIAIAAHKGY